MVYPPHSPGAACARRIIMNEPNLHPPAHYPPAAAAAAVVVAAGWFRMGWGWVMLGGAAS